MPVKDTQSKRISPAKLVKAKNGLTALGQLTDYSPQRKDFSATNAVAVSKTLKDASDAELAAQHALDKARDAATKAEWDAYDFMQSAEEQVAGQYGSSSDEYASLGYKKKSEYKKGRPAGGKNSKKAE